MGTVRLRFAEPLRLFLPARLRAAGMVDVDHEPGTPLRHVVPAAGVPLTEVGILRADGESVGADHRPRPGAVVDVADVVRPQPVAAWRFILDVHLGALARRMRLLGLDVAWSADAEDDALAARAVDETRVLLTQDHGLLRRRVLAPDEDRRARAAHVRGSAATEQIRDVLDRFAPPLAPFTRCTACGGALVPTSKDSVAHLLEPGTLRTYDEFVRCLGCGRPYWHGAHAARLVAMVRSDVDAAPGGRDHRRGPSTPLLGPSALA
uniref:Mut7-C ubiquitin/RNAse domain-containing protein n=1 Tax=Georgenia subflava TaxID=1622177 RepID=UPI001D02C057|nr:Mut7-C ubiquitin/RNAse domain-containing protein [Georgenia subflava]